MLHADSSLASVNQLGSLSHDSMDPMEIIRYEVLNHLDQTVNYLLKNSSTMESWLDLAKELVELRQRDRVLDLADLGVQIQQTASLSCDHGILELIGQETLRRIDIHKHRILSRVEHPSRRSA